MRPLRDRPMTRFLPVLALACAFVAGDASAWSAEGHRIVAHIADAGLTPAARAEVARLLEGEADPTLAGISTWADELRDSEPELGKRSARWHYINFDGRCGFEPPRDCKGNNCIVTQTNRVYRILADASKDKAERAMALKFVVHFVGDIHQPLHASPRDDKGGNEYQVNLRGEGSNLHRIWDGTIIERRGLAAEDFAEALLETPIPRDPTLSSDRPVLEWALESCRLVDEGKVYPAEGVHAIDDAFLDERLPLAEQRLREAGLRLAELLNHALAPAKQAP
ncbi:MAG TPA: S1/P1 nuclease [Luteimonas sp.]